MDGLTVAMTRTVRRLWLFAGAIAGVRGALGAPRMARRVECRGVAALITSDTTAHSVKTRAARAHGVPMVSYAEFLRITGHQEDGAARHS